MSAYFNQLYLVCGRDYIRYGILESDRNTFIAIADYQADPEKARSGSWKSGMVALFNTDELLTRKYPAVIAAFDSTFHTLLPSSLYDPGQLENYLRLNFELPEGLIIHTDHIAEMDAWNIWAIEPDLEEEFKKRFAQIVLFHSSTPLIKSILVNSNQDPGKNILHLHFTKNRFDLAVLSGNSLLFFNTFHFENDEDILYFTLYTAEQLRIRPEDATLKLFGDIEMTSDTVKLLREFLPETSFGSRPDGFNYSPLFDFPAHKYSSLFHLAICGS